MGIDTQKGPPVPKRPLEPTVFNVNPWFRRPVSASDVGKDSAAEDFVSDAPSIMIRCDAEARKAPAGAVVFIVSGHLNSAVVLVSDPLPRRLGIIGGPTGERLAQLCARNVSSITGKVLAGAGSESGNVRIQLDVQ